MNLLVVVLLALAAFYFLMSDMLSLAVVCVIGLVIVLYYYSSGDSRAMARESGGYGGGHASGHADGRGSGEGPMVVQLGHKHKKHPELYRVRIYPTWENRSMWEEFGKNFLGPTLNSVGGTIYRAASGKHTEKGMDIQPDEMMRGR